MCLSSISHVLELIEFGSILFHPEESVSLSIVHVGPYSVALVCVPPFIEYLFRVYLILWFLYFDLFQVKVQLVSKWNDGLHCYLFFGFFGFNIGMKLDLVVMFCKLFS
jgi:hypothetical protein